jgi:lipooligosaccharide transport system permease protein
MTVADLVPTKTPRLGTYWQTVYRRTWRGSVINSFFSPFLYLTGMGVGLGSFIDANSGPSGLDGVSYLQYVAPGLLATTAMQVAISESTFPVLGGFKWHRTYFSMAASPLRVVDIVAGQVTFTAFRIGLTSIVFLGVLAAYGAVSSVLGGIGALLVVVLMGLAYTTPMVAISSRMKSESGFALIYRLGILPMFLFSGAFFPITQLPDAITWLAYLTPIWHGVDLARALTLGTATWGPALGHVAYLLAWFLVGWYLAVTGFTRRLAW